MGIILGTIIWLFGSGSYMQSCHHSPNVGEKGMRALVKYLEEQQDYALWDDEGLLDEDNPVWREPWVRRLHEQFIDTIIHCMPKDHFLAVNPQGDYIVSPVKHISIPMPHWNTLNNGASQSGARAIRIYRADGKYEGQGELVSAGVIAIPEHASLSVNETIIGNSEWDSV